MWGEIQRTSIQKLKDKSFYELAKMAYDNTTNFPTAKYYRAYYSANIIRRWINEQGFNEKEFVQSVVNIIDMQIKKVN